MTSSYKVVFIASILITLGLFLSIMNSGSQNQAPTFFWVMTVWYMYKHDYQALVTLQKVMMGFAGLATVGVVIASFQEDTTISNLNLFGFSPYEMVAPGIISFCVHFWLLGFFHKQLLVDSDLTEDNTASQRSDSLQGGNKIGFDIWEAAAEEYDNNRNTGIWAMAFAESGGNEDKAKALYLKTRAEQLTNDSDQETFEGNISRSTKEMPAGTNKSVQAPKSPAKYRTRFNEGDFNGGDFWRLVLLILVIILALAVLSRV